MDGTATSNQLFSLSGSVLFPVTSAATVELRFSKQTVPISDIGITGI
ncbi:hypothetical protein ACT7C8_00965 [Bacillus cereus]